MSVKRYSPEEVARIATPAEQAQLRLGNIGAHHGRKGRTPPPLNVLFFARLCEQAGVARPTGKEYVFHETRKWKLDIVWLAERVAIEVHGGGWTHGRHNRSTGAMEDWVKMNEAQLHGWLVLQVPRSVKTFDDWMNMETVKLVRDAIALQAARPVLT